jgi:hypothetical protein
MSIVLKIMSFDLRTFLLKDFPKKLKYKCWIFVRLLKKNYLFNYCPYRNVQNQYNRVKLYYTSLEILSDQDNIVSRKLEIFYFFPSIPFHYTVLFIYLDRNICIQSRQQIIIFWMKIIYLLIHYLYANSKGKNLIYNDCIKKMKRKIFFLTSRFMVNGAFDIALFCVNSKKKITALALRTCPTAAPFSVA